MRFDHTGLEQLGEAECLQLLRSQSLGRVGVTSRALPMIFPVTYAVDRQTGSAVVRTAIGSNLEQAITDAVVAFEVDVIDEARHSGWSVLARSRVEEITDPQERRLATMLPLPCWGGQDDGSTRFLRIPLTHVSGRRLA